MHITFMPQRRDDTLSLSKDGEVLTVNGVAFDFSSLTEGDLMTCDTLECDWMVGDVTRTGGVIHLMLILPISADAPQESRFPGAIVAKDGPIPLLSGTI